MIRLSYPLFIALCTLSATSAQLIEPEDLEIWTRIFVDRGFAHKVGTNDLKTETELHIDPNPIESYQEVGMRPATHRVCQWSWDVAATTQCSCLQALKLKFTGQSCNSAASNSISCTDLQANHEDRTATPRITIVGSTPEGSSTKVLYNDTLSVDRSFVLSDFASPCLSSTLWMVIRDSTSNEIQQLVSLDIRSPVSRMVTGDPAGAFTFTGLSCNGKTSCLEELLVDESVMASLSQPNVTQHVIEHNITCAPDMVEHLPLGGVPDSR